MPPRRHRGDVTGGRVAPDDQRHWMPGGAGMTMARGENPRYAKPEDTQ